MSQAKECPECPACKDVVGWDVDESAGLARCLECSAEMPQANFGESWPPPELLPSRINPAKDCRHGGPPPDMMFMMTMVQSMGSIRSFQVQAKAALERKQDYVTPIGRVIEASESISLAVALVEFDTLLSIWSSRAHLIRADSYKVAFSCASDAVIDAKYMDARSFVRSGAFLRQWTKSGEDQFISDMQDDSAEARERLAEYNTCLWKTRTDRGVALYLAKQLPCECLRARKSQFKATEATSKCLRCEVQKPRAEFRACSRCKKAHYCRKECQRLDWRTHKRDCC